MTHPDQLPTLTDRLSGGENLTRNDLDALRMQVPSLPRTEQRRIDAQRCDGTGRGAVAEHPVTGAMERQLECAQRADEQRGASRRHGAAAELPRTLTGIAERVAVSSSQVVGAQGSSMPASSKRGPRGRKPWRW